MEFPLPLDSFVGRERELSELRALLKGGKPRLVTVTGPGGIGKSRLAWEFARRQRSARQGMLLAVELAGLAEGADPAQAVAVALGVGERGGRSGVEALVHALGERRLLLVLDNCEHVVDGAAGLVAHLLGRSGGLRVLAVSREALRVPGEVVVRIGELDTGESAGGPAGPGRPTVAVLSDAVRLFLDRAAASAPGFRPSGQELGTIAEICRRLEGMPLAIELAARRVGGLPVGAILSGLDDQLALLSDGSRTGPARHLDLHAAIDWSHRLLTPQEKALFRRLSVLRGGFDAGAAAAAADAGLLPSHRILPVLLSLEAKSLLVRTPAPHPPEALAFSVSTGTASPPTPAPGPGPRGGSGTRAGGGTASTGGTEVRFRELEPVRAYALQRLEESGEAEGTRALVVAWLVGLAGPPQNFFSVDHMPTPVLAEQENLAAAIADMPGPAGTPGGPPPVLIQALARVRLRQRQLSAARALLQAGPDWPDSRLQAARLTLATRVTNRQGDTEAALRFGERAVALARSLDHPVLLANALDARAFARLSRREIPQAVEDRRAAVAAIAALDRPAEEATAHGQLAWALLLAGCPAEADTLLTTCLPVLREHANPNLLAPALHTAGAVQLVLNALTPARELFAESLHTLPVESHGLFAIEGLAAVAAAQGDCRRALRLFTAATHSRSRLESETEPGWQDQITPLQARAAAALDRSTRRAAEAFGRALAWPALVRYALTEAEPGPTRPGTQGPAGPLTMRETLVAQLLTQGLTNHQIATRLKMSPRTVATHLDRIRDKLGTRTRTEIALWLAQHYPNSDDS